MASILKHWKEAATLLMIARNPRAVAEDTATAVQTVISGKKCSGEMTAVRSSDCDYKILLQKRSSKLGFFANAYVFPGGFADNTDFSGAWVDLFSSLGVDILSTYSQWQEKQLGNQAPMLSRLRHTEYSSFPTDLAFRICSIRETFEESGVLIARQPDDFHNVFQQVMSTNYSLASTFPLDMDSIRSWKERLYKDPSEFVTLCRELCVLPDIWPLYEWSNWLTPPIEIFRGQKQHRRFDTMFYACVLASEEKPLVVADDKETVHTMWSSPVEAFSAHLNEESYLAPPQAYEMARFLSIPSFQAVESHLKNTSIYRVPRWMPVLKQCADGKIAYLPGDQNYPAIPDFIGERPLPRTDANIADIQQESTHFNRFLFSKSLICNVDQTPVHANPISELQIEGQV